MLKEENSKIPFGMEKERDRMKKRKKKLLSGILAVLLIIGMFAGCSSGGNGMGSTEDRGDMPEAGSAAAAAAGNAKGRFIESEVELPEEVSTVYCLGKLSDGAVVALGADADSKKSYLFRSEDMGESWTAQETEYISGWISGSAVAPDGSVVVCGQFTDDAGNAFAMKRIAADGTTTDIPLALPEMKERQSENFVWQAGFDDAGRLFVLDLNFDLLEVDTDTGACTKFITDAIGDISYFGIAGEKLLLVTLRNGILLYGTEDGMKLKQDTVLDELYQSDTAISARNNERAFPVVFAAGSETGSLAYAGNGGIFFHLEEATVSEQLVNGELNSLGDPSIALYSLVMADEDNFLLLTGDETGDKLLRYSYDPEASAVPEKELTIYSLRDSDVLRQAIAIYQKEHQDVYVRLEIGLSEEYGITAEDAITALNAEILSGNGPDILILDGLPAESYIEKGVLLDISDVVEDIEQTDGLFPNIKNAYDRDGAIYEIPVRFYPIIVFGTPEAVAAGETLDTFTDYVKQADAENADRNQKILQECTTEELLWTLYQTDSADWQKEDGRLDEEKLSDWLNAAKEIYDVDLTRKDADGVTLYGSEYLQETVRSGIAGIILKENMSSIGRICSICGVANMLSEAEYLGGNYTYGLLNTKETACFVPYLKVGVNSTGNVPEEAKAFLMTLLGDECGSTDGNGFPINRAGYLDICQNGLEAYGNEEAPPMISFSDSEGTEVSYILDDLNQENVDAFTELLESLSTPALTDSTIEDVVLTEAENYLKGNTTLEETLVSIRQKLDLYLAER